MPWCLEVSASKCKIEQPKWCTYLVAFEKTACLASIGRHFDKYARKMRKALALDVSWPSWIESKKPGPSWKWRWFRIIYSCITQGEKTRPSKACPPMFKDSDSLFLGKPLDEHSKHPICPQAAPQKLQPKWHCIASFTWKRSRSKGGASPNALRIRAPCLKHLFLNILKLPRMLWATFLSTCFHSTVTTTEWIRMNPTDTYKRCTINMHSNVPLACSGLLGGQKLSKMDTCTHVFAWQCCSHVNKLRKHPAVHSLPFLHTHARMPFFVVKLSNANKGCIAKFKIISNISISQNHPKSPFPWGIGSINERWM